MFLLEMSELISCVEIHTCMHAFICLILCVTRSSVVSLQVINMWKYIQSTFVLVPFIQGIKIGFYVWTLIWCIYLIASSPCCTQHPKLQQRNKYNVFKYVFTFTHLHHYSFVSCWFYGVLLHEYKFVLICIHCTYKQCNCKSWFIYILLFIIFFK